MITFLVLIFLISLFLIIHAYFIYPLILCLWARLLTEDKRGPGAAGCLPKVSVIISAYNEEKVLEEKLNNCLYIDYPVELIEFIVASDGSTDRTADIAEKYSKKDSRIKLFRFENREGKGSILNRTIPRITSDIVLLSDADTIYEKDAVKKIVRNFTDNKIGGVCGRLLLSGEEGGCAEEALYWRYENMVKMLESRIKTITAINGQIFAIRKELFERLPEGAITEDQVLGMNIIRKGYNILFEPEAICREKACSIKGEFRRRIRISAGNFQSLSFFKDILNPKYGFISFSLWSHKVLRWFVPFFMTAIFLASLLLSPLPFFKFAVICQVIFYLSSFINCGLFKRIAYFNIMNAAILTGFFKAIFGMQKVTWEKT